MRTMRAWVVCLIALLCLLPLTVDADTPPQRLPAPVPGVIYGDFNDGFAPVQVGQKYGFIDKTGKFAIPAQFDDAIGFYDLPPNTLPQDQPATTAPALAAVKVGDTWGYIDTTGKRVIAPQFDDATPFTTDGVASVKVGDKWGYINKAGTFVIPARYDDVSVETSEGLAAVKLGDLWGFASTKTGQLVIAPRFEGATNFIGGLGKVVVGGLFGFIFPDGTFAITPQFADASEFGPEGLASVVVSGAYARNSRLGSTPDPNAPGGGTGFIDRTGRFVIPPHFEFTTDFHEGLAQAQLNGKVGFIDRSGAFVIPPTFVPDPNTP